MKAVAVQADTSGGDANDETAADVQADTGDGDATAARRACKRLRMDDVIPDVVQTSSERAGKRLKSDAPRARRAGPGVSTHPMPVARDDSRDVRASERMANRLQKDRRASERIAKRTANTAVSGSGSGSSYAGDETDEINSEAE